MYTKLTLDGDIVAFACRGTRPEGETVSVADLDAARRMLRRCIRNHHDVHALRSVYTQLATVRPADRLSDHQLLGELARRLAAGDVVVVRRPGYDVPGGTGFLGTEEQVEDVATPLIVESAPLTWIEVELQRPDGSPVMGAHFRVVDSTGQTFEGELDESGRARVESVAEGDCEVSFPSLGPETLAGEA